ncbi:hypothetical protein ACFL3P_02610 [Pseudomonadota bacterium]
MSKHALILLHGMGIHTAESFKQEIINGTNTALKRYPSYKNIKFEDKVDLISISYDHIFEERRNALANSGLGIKDLIKDMGGVDLPGVVETIARIDAELGGDKFAHTHLLDVVLYLTLVGEKVRLYVEQEIAGVLREYPSSNVSFLAHSLGTAVLHDSLHKLYTTGGSSGTQINTGQFNLSSIWMFANVSQLITTFSGLTSPTHSLVKPGPGGCTNTFFNIFNSFDPFTLKPFKRFNPPNDGKWIDKTTYQYSYRSIETSKVSRANTHSIEGYLEDPEACHLFLNHFLDDGFAPDEQEKKAGDNAFKHIEDEANKIKNFISTVDDKGDLVALLKMITDFYKYLKSMGEEL